MTLARLLYILGIILIVYALVSGLKLSYTFDAGQSYWESGFQFKLGSFLLGVVLLYSGRRKTKS
jgi:hypothetical protein